jgi:hypothetical protein
MLSVSKTPAARKGTPEWEELPVIGATFPDIQAIFRYILVCFIINFKKDNTSNVVSPSLEYCMHVLSWVLQNNPHFRTRMCFFLRNQNPTAEDISKCLKEIVCGIIRKNGIQHKFGVSIHEKFSEDYKLFHTDYPNWNSFFKKVLIQMFPPESELQTIRNIVATEKENKMLKRDVEQLKFENSKRRDHFAQNAITVQVPFVSAYQPGLLINNGVKSIHKLVVPAQVPEVQKEDNFLEIVEVPLDQESGNDAKELILAVVKSALEDCVANAVALAANAGKSVQPEEQSSDEFEPGDYEAELLFLKIDGQSENQFHANGSGGRLDSESPGIKALQDSNTILAEIQHLHSSMESLPTGFRQNVDDAANQIASILGVIQGFKASLLPDGEGRAHFTTSAQSPPHGVEDGASGAHPPFSLANSLEFTNGSKSFSSNPGSDFSSGQSGTSPTHVSSMLLAASIDPSPQSSFTPAAVTSADSSNLVQSSSKPLAPAPPLPPKTDVVRWKMNGGGAQSSGIPNGNPPGNAQSNVGVGRNPHADQPSFPSKGDVGGPPPVQVLAQSGDPPGNSGGADHPKTPSSNVLGSGSSQDGTDLSASLPHPNLFGINGKPVRPLPPTPVNPPSRRTGIGGSPSVEHLSDNQSRSAATTPPLSLSTCPSGHDIGGSQGAQSSGDPPEIVPSSAPSSSSALRSAATPALSPQSCPSGHDIGGTKRSGKMLDITMVLLFGAHLLRLGVPLAQAPLFSHIPPAQEAQAVEVA